MVLEQTGLFPALIHSARDLSAPGDLCLFSFSIAISTPKTLNAGTSGSTVYTVFQSAYHHQSHVHSTVERRGDLELYKADT